jgi:hypothetical protein
MTAHELASAGRTLGQCRMKLPSRRFQAFFRGASVGCLRSYCKLGNRPWRGAPACGHEGRGHATSAHGVAAVAQRAVSAVHAGVHT